MGSPWTYAVVAALFTFWGHTGHGATTLHIISESIFAGVVVDILLGFVPKIQVVPPPHLNFDYDEPPTQ